MQQDEYDKLIELLKKAQTNFLEMIQDTEHWRSDSERFDMIQNIELIQKTIIVIEDDMRVEIC